MISSLTFASQIPETRSPVSLPRLTINGKNTVNDLFQANAAGGTAGNYARVTSAGLFSCSLGQSGSEIFGAGAANSSGSPNNTVFGNGAQTSFGQGSVAIGQGANAGGSFCVALGASASISGSNTANVVLIGRSISAGTNAAFSIAINASNAGFGSCIGLNGSPTAASQCVLGGITATYLGVPSLAIPVAQTLTLTSVLTGTSNTAGVNLTIAGSQGTGTGVGGSLIFQVAPAGTTGSTPNALSTALTIDSTKTSTFNGYVVIGNAGSPGGNTYLYITSTGITESRINSNASSNNCFTSYYQGGTLHGLFGLSGGVDSLITGTVASDFAVRNSQAILFSTDGGTTATITLSATSNAVLFNGKITKYNNISTVSNGIPSELAKIDTTGLQANVTAATLYVVPSTGAGMYRISAYVVETTAGSVSSTLPNVQIVYTDPDTNTSITIDATPVLGAAGIGQTGALTANTIGTASCGDICINVKASTNIQYQTVNYASSLAGMTYSLHIKLEAL